ncbi:nucleotidyltransferase domain-containing protein [Enterococcus durans]|uniref:Nucleotidyltransferase domain-containing protein n=1 Tax=Enterococcus durans TaxID=53345 RepID=A0A5N0YU63_9ENTE|nr:MULTISPECIES: nucleotidyltransferase domain-containing protein [Enterococcus]KAA9176449.1 nucleotidyltransferase domain-containing protein [Enterococcus durans]KAA9182315.1 nucleotidyltransferase domain-containing protein [Enterococcus durans]KAA9186672.1 nucleotidyltransferase domain-containing protein [Enterococcus durans]KAA9191477.1 nucleotidyltransferase domain-containing protein [Enterococcus durans]KAA9193546.1 nucleotidyltransferase domain-containing protein [Enterococcus durans]
MLFTVEEIQERVKPVAEKYQIPIVYIFGSYARNEATNESDIDFLVETKGMPESNYWVLYGEFFEELKEAVEHEIDLVEMEALSQPKLTECQKQFLEKMMKERIKIFEK